MNIILILFLIIRSAAIGATLEQAPDPAKADAVKKERALELLALARAAVGGEQALIGIKSISASARLRSFARYVFVKSPTKVEERGTILKGKIKIEFLLPDKSRSLVSSPTLSGFRETYALVTNGDRAWRDPPLIPVSTRRERHVIDVSDYEKSLVSQAQDARENLSFYSLAWLLQASPNLKLEYRYDGLLAIDGTTVDNIELTGSGNLRVYFLLDRKTHLPFGFIINVVATIMDPVLTEFSPFDSRNRARLTARARQEIASRSKPPQRYSILLRFSDHRRVEGLLLPHRLTTSINEKLYEDLKFSSFSVNGHLNPKDFVPPSARK